MNMKQQYLYFQNYINNSLILFYTQKYIQRYIQCVTIYKKLIKYLPVMIFQRWMAYALELPDLNLEVY